MPLRKLITFSKSGPWLPLVTGGLCTIAFAFFIFRYLSQFDDPPGVNGYFYLKQIWSLGQTHSFYFKDHSLAFALPAFLDVIFHDELFAMRLTIALFMAALLALHGLLNFRLTRDIRWTLLIVGVGLALNLSFYEFSLGYLKNLTAAVFFLGTLYFCVRETGYRSGATALVLALLAFLSHKSVLLLVMVLGLSLLIRFRRWSLALAAILVAVGLCAAFAAVFSQGGAYLVYLQGQLHWNPTGYAAWFATSFKEKNLIYLLLASVPVFAFNYLPSRRQLTVTERLGADFALILGLVACLPLGTPGEDQAMYRIMILYATLGLPLTMGYLCRLNSESARFSLGVVVGLVVAQFALSRPLILQIPNYAPLRSPAQRLHEFVGPADHLTCHHGLEFFIDYVTGIRCEIFISDRRDQKQWRLVYAPAFDPWARVRAFSSEVSLLNVGPYLLVREDKWAALVKEIGIPPHWRNPMDHRPDFIYSP